MREAGIPPGATTYVLKNEGKSGTWSEGFLAISYAVQVNGWDYTAVKRQPHLTIVPDDPIERPLSFVFFAATIWHKDVKWSYLKAIWPFHDLSLPERFEIVNGLDASVPDSDNSKLMKGRRFLRETVLSHGRPLGTKRWADGEEILFQADVERTLACHERQGIRITNAQMLADKIGTSRRSLFTMFDRVPAARARFEEHKHKGPSL